MTKRVIISLSLIVIILSLLLFYTLRPDPELRLRAKLEELSTLTTGIETYREIIYSKTTGDIFWIPLKNKEILFSIEYRIQTGIDLSKGYKIFFHKDFTEIVLPHSQVISIDADDLSIKEYFIKERFSSISRDDYFSIINDTKLKLAKDDSIEKILQESDKKAKSTIESLFKISGDNVKVSFSNIGGER